MAKGRQGCVKVSASAKNDAGSSWGQAAGALALAAAVQLGVMVSRLNLPDAGQHADALQTGNHSGTASGSEVLLLAAVW